MGVEKKNYFSDILRFCIDKKHFVHGTVADVHREPQWFNTAHYKSLVMITKK